jgi:hypothetical protein
MKIDWKIANQAAQQANANYGQWMPERWLQLFVKAYDALAAQPPAQDGDVPMPEPKIAWLAQSLEYYTADQLRAYGDARAAAALASAGKPSGQDAKGEQA